MTNRQHKTMALSGFDAADVGWLAGFFEGEGSFGVVLKPTKCAVAVSVHQNDIEPLLRMQKICGGAGAIYLDARSRRGVGNDIYDYRVMRFEHVQQIVAMMWPHLSARRQEQARVMLTSFANRPSKPRVKSLTCGKGHVFDDENTGRHRTGARYCKRCNRERSNGRG